MKKQSINTITKRLFAGVIAAILFFTVAPNATKANAVKDSTVFSENNTKGNIEYVGSSNENYYFRVKFQNADAEPVQILVVDENGEYINRFVTKDKQYNKFFVLPKDSDINKVMFIIKSNAINVKQSFVVEFTTNTIADVVASKN
ncbi:MAG: hypothetical protein J0I09_05790 [Sphingobacteriia bacterium]|nr:hypothetical protein [Sphingobacteriia bacterium]